MDTLEDEEEDEEEGEDDGRWDSDPEPPVLLVSDLNDDLLSGSYLTVTLQRPHKARRQAGTLSAVVGYQCSGGKSTRHSFQLKCWHQNVLKCTKRFTIKVFPQWLTHLGLQL